MKQELISLLAFSLTVLFFAFAHRQAVGQSGKESIWRIKKTSDFSIDGKGTAKNWSKTKWIPVSPITDNAKKSNDFRTKAKVLYSETGIYFLFECKDRVLTATMNADFMKLWTEDVVEVFLWPDERLPTYFEYEISPLNYEIVLLISNKEDSFTSWRPYTYEGDMRTRHKTSVQGGEKKSGASVTQWTAEFFIPYQLLQPFTDTPPDPDTRWRANLYRIDYDSGQKLLAWQPVKESFHEYEKFGTFIFE